MALRTTQKVKLRHETADHIGNEVTGGGPGAGQDVEQPVGEARLSAEERRWKISVGGRRGRKWQEGGLKGKRRPADVAKEEAGRCGKGRAAEDGAIRRQMIGCGRPQVGATEADY